MSNSAVPSREEIDSELSLAIIGYDPQEKWPEWSNSAMREAYRAGWEDGKDGALKPIRARHYPVELAHTLSGQHKTVCAHCHRGGFFTLEPERGDWPCADAKDIYSSEELS